MSFYRYDLTSINTPNPLNSFDALIVFAKVPEPGVVKTRLTSLLTKQEAAMLYRAFLRDALDQYDRLPCDVRLYLSTSSVEAGGDGVNSSHQVFLQAGHYLGDRMAHAFAESFAEGYERLVIVGTDHPTLPNAFIEQAFEALEEPCSVSLGPAADGGYYLMGMKDFLPHLFKGMSYSHKRVFEETLNRARNASGSLTILPEWYDVDTPEDLRRLADDLSQLPDTSAKHSRRVVHDLIRAYPQFFGSIDLKVCS